MLLTEKILLFCLLLVPNSATFFRELQLCEENRTAAEQEVKRLREILSLTEKEIEQLRSERASINTMLDTELTRR